MSTTAGIASIGLQLPPLYMPVTELAELRSVDPNKFTKGLGCKDIALCPAGHDAVTLAVGAAKRALSRWDGSIEDIGLIALGTESAKDMSRPLSAWVADDGAVDSAGCPTNSHRDAIGIAARRFGDGTP